MISIYIFVMGRKEKERREEGTENEPLGGDWEGLLGEREEEEEGCVVVVVAVAVDFAMGAFNIKPWAINGQAGEQAGEGGRAGGKRASGRTDGVVSEWKPCRVWADRHLHFHKLRSSER